MFISKKTIQFKTSHQRTSKTDKWKIEKQKVAVKNDFKKK